MLVAVAAVSQRHVERAVDVHKAVEGVEEVVAMVVVMSLRCVAVVVVVVVVVDQMTCSGRC